MERTVYKYVAVIGLDGMGIFNKYTPTPYMDKIFENGAVSYKGLSMDPTISAENWGAMLLGAKPTVHKLTNSVVGRIPYENADIPSVFKRIREKMPEAYLASYSTWKPINKGIIEDNVNVEKETAQSDAELCPKITEAVKNKPTFLFVQFDNIDGAGHKNGYGKEGHLLQISKTDELVNDIYEAYKNAGILDDTLFVVTADHGGYNRSHGGYHDTEKYVFIGAAGKGVKKGEITGYQTRDIASVVLYALGLEVPVCDERGFSSLVPEGIFPELVSEKRPEPQVNFVETRETPLPDSKDGIFSFIPKENFTLCMFTDNNLDDATGNHTPKEIGTVKYYTNGITGAFSEWGLTGHITIPEIDLNEGNMTFSVWLNIDRTLTDSACIFASRDLGAGQSVTGISLQMRCNDTMFLMADGDDDLEVVTPFPDSISEGWVNVIISVDRDNKKLAFYDNFELVNTIDIEDRYLGNICSLPFTVGDNSYGNFNTEKFPCIFRMDDFIIFNIAFCEKEVKQ